MKIDPLESRTLIQLDPRTSIGMIFALGYVYDRGYRCFDDLHQRIQITKQILNVIMGKCQAFKED